MMRACVSEPASEHHGFVPDSRTASGPSASATAVSGSPPPSAANTPQVRAAVSPAYGSSRLAPSSPAASRS
ncbi:hypothetical protein [Clavibacter michiganensis]|uniref:hypothetical protein n=1 Tax=Clavibacter michiganensis TaxID=28447 RepID=UPI003EB71F04